MFQLLRRPYPIDKSTARLVLVSVLFGAFVFGFLRFFEPFGITGLPDHKTAICAGFGLWCTAAVFALNFGVVRLFPRVFRESNWTVGKEMAWVTFHCAFIGLGNAAYAVLTGMTHWSKEVFLTYEVYTVAVGIFPISISVLLAEVRLNRRYREQSAELNTHLPKEQTVPAGITLPSDNKNEQLTIAAQDLVCLEAADNYVTVYHAEAGRVRKTVLRSTLKAQEEQLSAIPTIFRPHKSYLVNCDHIERVSGNAQGYKLHLAGLEEPVPVSRKQNEELRKRLTIPSEERKSVAPFGRE